MSERIWEISKSCFCDRLNQQVTLEVERVYPGEHLPDLEPRVLAHRCSNGLECNQSTKSACLWAATNPDYDPF